MFKLILIDTMCPAVAWKIHSMLIQTYLARYKVGKVLENYVIIIEGFKRTPTTPSPLCTETDVHVHTLL